jgi:2-oxo-4-hydroxy-4-carboxy-5-ureidoimidazoline decarboxylase
MTMEMSMPTVKELLSKPTSEITSFLGGIYEHSVWVAEELVQRADAYASFETVTDLAARMKSIVDDASKEKKMELLCAHPDLCEKVGKFESLTEESIEEQSRSGLQSLTEEETERFNTMNTAYRTKFGFPFILAVRNATKFTVLAALEGRLPHPVEKEFVIALEQVHKIAWMRLLSKISTVDAKGFLTCHVLDTANGCPGTSYSVGLIALIQSRLACFSFVSLLFVFCSFSCTYR